MEEVSPAELAGEMRALLGFEKDQPIRGGKAVVTLRVLTKQLEVLGVQVV